MVENNRQSTTGSGISAIKDRWLGENMLSERSGTAVINQEALINRSPSVTTSLISLTGTRDYGMKFIPGADGMTNSMTLAAREVSTPAVAVPTPPEVSNPFEAAPMPPETAAMAYEPPPYWDQTRDNGREDNSGFQDEIEAESECHPFWTAWWDMARGVALMITGSLKIPFVIGHGLTKVLWYIPVLYGDNTIWEWPNITGFPSGCKAALESLWFGLFQGLTDWVVLPYKGAKSEGVLGCVKGFCKSIWSFAFKPAAGKWDPIFHPESSFADPLMREGTAGFIFHPFFGIYKEASAFKLVIKRERKPRKKGISPV
ncbi:hypothetical protein DL769_007565 [Monosporascus sp. CRB-8-3]|nr:hypothetical protein DL769_007565 [Monosporascus sp. CRB-8-3]